MRGRPGLTLWRMYTTNIGAETAQRLDFFQINVYRSGKTLLFQQRQFIKRLLSDRRQRWRPLQKTSDRLGGSILSRVVFLMCQQHFIRLKLYCLLNYFLYQWRFISRNTSELLNSREVLLLIQFYLLLPHGFLVHR